MLAQLTSTSNILFFGLASILIMFTVFTLIQRERKENKLLRLATKKRWNYSKGINVSDVGSLFRTLDTGDSENGSKNALGLSQHGIHMQSFDYWYYKYGNKGLVRHTTTAFLVDLAAPLVDTVVDERRENNFPKLGLPGPLAHPIARFEDKYLLYGADTNFALTLFDKHLSELLVEKFEGWRIEIRANYLLVTWRGATESSQKKTDISLNVKEMLKASELVATIVENIPHTLLLAAKGQTRGPQHKDLT